MDNLATEILRELKLQCRRYFIMMIIALVLLFASNIAWLYAWNLPDKEISESYELSGQDDANVVYNDSGEVQIDGEN